MKNMDALQRNYEYSSNEIESLMNVQKEMIEGEKMKTIVCQEPFMWKITERKKPKCQLGEALVRVRRIGICGTDIHAFGGNQPYFTYPRVLGHELSGTVEEVKIKQLGY